MAAVTELSSSLADVVGPEGARDYAKAEIFTEADALSLLPVDYDWPPPLTPVRQLIHGSDSVVRGRVISYERELMEVSGFARRISVPVSTLLDGSGVPLRANWIEQRKDGPAGLAVGRMVLLRGVVRRFTRSRVAGLVTTTAHFEMTNPWIGLVRDPPAWTPGIDAPLARYADVGPVEGWKQQITVTRILDSLELPATLTTTSGKELQGSDLRKLLEAMHRPTHPDRVRWARENTEWLKRALAGGQSPARAMPEPRLLKTWSDAENYAAEVMSALGFTGVHVSPSGRDGGVDVRAKEAVAQVKMEGVKTDAPKVQALSGIAAHEGRQPLFFSLAGYTGAAVKWAEQARVALFEFDYSGGIVARSSAAIELQSHDGVRS